MLKTTDKTQERFPDLDLERTADIIIYGKSIPFQSMGVLTKCRLLMLSIIVKA